MSKNPAAAAEMSAALEDWKHAVYTARLVLGDRLRAEMDLDKFTAATDKLISRIVAEYGPGSRLIVPISGMKERILLCVRTGQIIPNEEYLALRGKADAAVNLLKETCQDRGTGTSGQRRRKPGRPPDTDPKKDQKIHDAWQTGHCTNFADLALELKTTRHEVVKAVDRHRKRLKRKSP